MNEINEEKNSVEDFNPTPDKNENKKSKSTPILVAILIIVLAGFSAYQYITIDKNNKEIQALKEMNIVGEGEQKKLNSYIAEITETIDAVETKLSDVRQKQVTIRGMLSDVKGEQSQKARAFDDIAAIEDQLQRDKKDIQALRDKMRKSNIRIKLLDQMVENLQNEIEKNEKNMAELRSVIDEKNLVIKVKDDSLSASKENLKQVKNELELTNQILDETRNTAFFTTGTKKALLASKIIEETGFMKKTINMAKDFNTESFDKVNISRDSSFNIKCKAKDAKIIPLRAESSYKIEDSGSGSVLTIVNPEQFWKIRYLVVIVKG